MSSFFEPDAFFLDPTSYDDAPSSFLSFSSFADLAHVATSPFDISSWEYGSSKSLKSRQKEASEPVTASQPPSDGTFSGSSSPRDPFSVAELAFEPNGPVGIFVESVPPRTVADGNPSSSHSYRSSASSNDTWDEPITPALSNRASIESFASTSTIHPSAYKHAAPAYAWDDTSTGLGTASGFIQTPHRTTSNPTLNRNQPRVARPIASMPALTEEDSSTPSAWFDGTEQIESTLAQPSTGAALPLTQQPVGGASSLEESNELAEDFGWAFGEYGLGIADIPPESTIFAAFQTDCPAGGSSSTDGQNPQAAGSYSAQPQKLDQQQQQQWLPTPMVQDTSEYSYDYGSFAHLPTFTVDPMSIMTAPLGGEEEQSRPSSAPGLNGGESSGQMLSVPMADPMTRSVSSESFVHARRAPPRDLFSYTPQQIPAGPPAPQPLYTTDPSPSFSHYPREMPVTPTHPRRASMHGLAIQIQPTQYSTYSQSPLPPTPQSATFGEFNTPQMQPVMMTRAGTQPLPHTRRMSGSGPSSVPLQSRNLSHYGRMGLYPLSQEAKEEAQHQEIRRIAASRRLSMAQNGFVSPPSYQDSQYAQSSQPQQYQQHAQSQPQRQAIMGWEGPSAQTGTLPVLTTAPLVPVHPPPANQTVVPGTGGLSTPHKIHPPPHPGSAGRPVARLPASPAKRKVSNTPTKRSPSVKKRQTSRNAGGAFSWGETFINFTSDDAEKLLTGVAPSGSQGKRKREEEMGKEAGGEDGVEMVRERSKRSKSDE